jgi:hypothetical protein
MLRLHFSISPKKIIHPQFILFSISWAFKYQSILDSVSNNGLQISEIIRTFAQVPTEMDCSEIVSEYIYSVDPTVYEDGKHYIIDYVVEMVMEEFYRKLDSIIRDFGLNYNYNYLFESFYDPSTMLLRVELK